ncbi:MAG: Obg family GTPase CgtA, partial [Candidatus Wallbacteria bacterium]|nr:Obg family GTPase CgtA [Candidatus Wallbacteria bacterium]
LKLLADVGIIGLPNAGKSTLISVVSNCKPKIADYPFTTIAPNLGVVKVGEYSFTMADIPGLIEGAHTGSGLGDRFLRHVDRTRILLHLVDCQHPDPVVAYLTVHHELECYNPSFGSRFQVVALSKTDIFLETEGSSSLKDYCAERGIPFFTISAATHRGISEMMSFIGSKLGEIEKELPEDSPDEFRVYHIKNPEKPLNIVHQGNTFHITGSLVERVAARVDFRNPFALRWFQGFLKEKGITDRLHKMGISSGNTVEIGAISFEYFEDD